MNSIPGVGGLYEMYEYSPDTLLISQKNGPAFLNITTGKITQFTYKPDYNFKGWQCGVACFFEESDNKLWIGSCGGLFLFDKGKGKFINLEKQMKGFEIFRNKVIRKIHKDRKGNLWVATWSDGVFKVDFDKKKINTHLQNGTLSSARSIMETKEGHIWIGTRGGIAKYISQSDTFTIFKNELNDPKSMSESTGFCLYEDKENNIWVGTYGGGLNKLDIKCLYNYLLVYL